MKTFLAALILCCSALGQVNQNRLMHPVTGQPTSIRFDPSDVISWHAGLDGSITVFSWGNTFGLTQDSDSLMRLMYGNSGWHRAGIDYDSVVFFTAAGGPPQTGVIGAMWEDQVGGLTYPTLYFTGRSQQGFRGWSNAYGVDSPSPVGRAWANWNNVGHYYPAKGIVFNNHYHLQQSPMLANAIRFKFYFEN